MCMFSQPVEHVSKTCLYARGVGPTQLLVYAMSVAASDDLAMLLPLPVAPGVGDEGVRFIDLSSYPTFFTDVRRAFPVHGSLGFGVSRGGPPAPAPQPLPVHRVGAFEASFVPTLRDFERLDPRFRLSPELWAHLPQYSDFGFAVFKLRRSTVPQNVHPMAFAFQRRDPSTLFFPTLHVHDGQVHGEADFDHDLYCQTPTALLQNPGWTTSDRALSFFVDAARVPDLIDWHAPAHRLILRGRQPNRDVVFAAEDSIPPVFE